MAVDIVAEVDTAEVVYPGGEVDDVDRYRWAYGYLPLLMCIQQLADMVGLHSGVAAEDIIGQPLRLREAYTAVAEGSARLVEEALGRRIMEEDVKAIWEEEGD